MHCNRLSLSPRDDSRARTHLASHITKQGSIVNEKGRAIALERKVPCARSTSNDAF